MKGWVWACGLHRKYRGGLVIRMPGSTFDIDLLLLKILAWLQVMLPQEPWWNRAETPPLCCASYRYVQSIPDERVCVPEYVNNDLSLVHCFCYIFLIIKPHKVLICTSMFNWLDKGLLATCKELPFLRHLHPAHTCMPIIPVSHHTCLPTTPALWSHHPSAACSRHMHINNTLVSLPSIPNLNPVDLRARLYPTSHYGSTTVHLSGQPLAQWTVSVSLHMEHTEMWS